MILASMNLHGRLRSRWDAVRRRDRVPSAEGRHDRAAGDLAASQPDPLAEAARELGARLIRADLLRNTDLRSLHIAPDASPGQWGLAVLTVLPVTGYELVDLGRFWGDPASRAAQLITVTTPTGESLRVANTHLTHLFFSPVQLVRLARRLAASTVPTVITGDLNMPGPVTGYSPAVHGRTFPGSYPLVQLDHVLTGRAVRADDGQVLPAAGSDHLPIRACVQVG